MSSQSEGDDIERRLLPLFHRVGFERRLCRPVEQAAVGGEAALVTRAFEQVFLFHVMQGAAEVRTLAGHGPHPVITGKEDELGKQLLLSRRDLFRHLDQLRLPGQAEADEAKQRVEKGEQAETEEGR